MNISATSPSSRSRKSVFRVLQEEGPVGETGKGVVHREELAVARLQGAAHSEDRAARTAAMWRCEKLRAARATGATASRVRAIVNSPRK